MVEIRKHALAFAGVACFLGVTGSASAQSFTGFGCTANAATPFQMRAEGITEQAGDILLTCTGGTQTPINGNVPQVNITVSLNTQVTSRLLGTPNNLTDALLLVNDPAANTQTLCANPLQGCTLAGTGRGGSTTAAEYGANNSFEGVLTAANQLTFFGVPIDPPGPVVPPATTTPVMTLRVTNVRANASSLGAPTGFSSTSVTGFISTSAGFNITNPSLTIGSVFTGLLQGIVSGGVVVNPVVSGYSSSASATLGGLSASILNGGIALYPPSGSTPSGLNQCTSRSLSSSNTSAALVEYINFTEGFATATKLRTALAGVPSESIPGNFQNAESQFIPTFAGGYGLADFGTRIRLLFANLPTGVTLYAPTSLPSNTTVGTTTTTGNVTTTTYAPTEVLSLTSSESGAFSLVTPGSVTGATGFAALTVTGGASELVYEVSSQLTQSSNTVESFSVPILMTYTASPGTNTPTLGNSTVQISFAPVSTVQVASTGPIPRFIPSLPVNNAVAISACSTNLLFPFVTNQAGFDTGLAIASTSTDPFGTTPQSGTCALNFYGAGAPAAYTTATVASGTVYTSLLSSVAAGFQGYIIARCNFQYAHGFAFVTDGFGGPGRGLSQGYLPLIIPDTSIQSRGPNPNIITSGAGEILSN